MEKPELVKVRKSNYSVWEMLKYSQTVLWNRLQFPTARLVRYPIVVRGKKYIDFGRRLTTGYHCRLEVNGRHTGKVLTFGRDVNIGDYASIRCAKGITIGDHVLMGSRVLVTDNAHGKYKGSGQDAPCTAPNQRRLQAARVRIGDDVWIGEGCVVQMGVAIGSGSIIAANSVVVRDVPSRVIAGGVPARVLKKWNERSQTWDSVENKKGPVMRRQS